MKKILLSLLILLCIPFSIFGINGDGSFATPYNGPLTANMTWSGTVYVNGDITVDAFTLTISPGTIIIFLAAGSDIIITGTGVLTASGSAASMIRFTADANNNGIYGETGERWGHISFQNMTPGFTTPSVINYCIVEFGQKNSSPYDNEARGGGINTTFSFLTISNSIIRNNYAGIGGGICVNSGANSSISNCLISNNTAGTTGGGLLIDQSPRSSVNNSIITKNTCSGPGGGGGIFIGSNSTNVTFYNCTIVSNISTVNQGNNIRFYLNNTAPRPRFYNTIIWGSNNSIGYYAQAAAAADFNFCAIQGYTSGYTSCINLNATNGDPAGPNFVDPNILNYAITGLSPCRNAGTSTGAPTTDYLGRPRILPYDIGAYEYISILWKLTAATTDWTNAANWDGGVPTSANDIIIPTGAANYPTNTPGPDFTVGPGSSLTLGPGAKATLGAFINNGSLTLQSDGTSGCASFIAGSYSGNDATIELFLTGGEASGAGTKTFKWHYISTPVSSLAVSTFSPTYTTNLAKYWDDRVAGSLVSGWVKYNGYIYSTGGTDPVRQFSSLLPGIGYDYYAVQDNKITFAGQLNTSDITMSLSYAVDDALHGFNLLGNPFSSGLDWSLIAGDKSFPLNTSKTVYFTRDNTQCSFVGGVGIPSDVTGIIPPMQGFFVKTYSAGNSLEIRASARAQNAIHSRYKGLEIVPLVRLSITENLVTDETVVRFDAAAKSGVDYDFDAIKMFISTSSTQIYSSLGGTNYSINGLPYPDPSIEIPIVVNFLTTGNHSINATQLQGLDNYSVTLTDKSTGFVADLKTTPVLTFSATVGTIADRFVLKIGTITTGTENPLSTKGTFNIYPSYGFVNIQTLADDWDGKSGSVKIQDLTGKVVGTMNNTTFSKNSLTTVHANFAKGIYLVELKSGLKRYVGKVVIR
jgi:hypothetical protein